MTDTNNFGAYAAIAVDSAGTEHAVWENNGQIWHARFDEAANQWVEGAPITNAEGGRELQLITGNLIPYGNANNEEFAPALVALWEDGSNELNYVVGRFTETGELEWSDAVDFGAPTLNNENGTVITQKPRAVISPEVEISGRVTKPAIAVVYEVVDERGEIVGNWRGTDSNGNPYQANVRFSGEDKNGDGIISGRSDNSTLGDGVENELSTWSVQFIDANGEILDQYDLEQQQALTTFNFNYDPDNLVVLANADAETFNLSTTEYGLNIGLNREAEGSGELWQLNSDVTNIFGTWTGSDGYQVIISFAGSDLNGDGIISGRGTNSTIGDGIVNELSAWEMRVLQNGTEVLATPYDLAEQLTRNDFIFNYDLNTGKILANKVEVNSENSLQTLNIGSAVRESSVTNYNFFVQGAGPDLVLTEIKNAPQVSVSRTLASDEAIVATNGGEIKLEQIPNGSSESTAVAETELGNTQFTIGSSVIDDVDLYTDFISFSQDATNTLIDSAGNTLTFEEVAENNPPDIVRAGTEVQFLTADTVAQAGTKGQSGTEQGTLLGASGESPSFKNSVPFGATQSFNLSLAAARRMFTGFIPLPASSIFPSSSNRTLTLSGSIGGSRSGKDTYSLSTKLSLGNSPSYSDTPSTLNPFKRNVKSQTGTSVAGRPSSGSLTDRATPEYSLSLAIKSKYKPNEDGDLEYAQGDIVVSFGYGQTYQLRLQIPPTPSALAGELILGTLSLSYLNLTLSADVAFNIEDPSKTLPIHIEGNVTDPSSIQIVNDALGSTAQILDGVLGAAGGMAQLFAIIGSTDVNAPGGPGADSRFATASPYLNNAALTLEVILGLVYASQILEETGFLLDGAFNDPETYKFDNVGLNFAYNPSLSGSVGVLANTLKGGANASLSVGGGLDIFNNGAVQLQAQLAESLGASASVFGWNWSWNWSANQTFKKNIAGTPPESLSVESEETTSDSNVGEAGLVYSPTPGTGNLYDDSPLLGTTATSQNLVDDTDIDVVIDTNTGTAFTVWVASGEDSSESLAESQDHIGRVLVSVLDSSARGWDSPKLVSKTGASETAPPVSGFAFDPVGEFFYTDNGAFVAPSEIDFNNPKASIEYTRIIAWAFSETAADLDASSSSDDVSNAVQTTDIYFSTSSRNLSQGTFSPWSEATLAFQLEGTDRLPTLGVDPNGTLRLAWVNDTTVAEENVSTIYTSTFNPSTKTWTEQVEVAQQADARITTLLLDSFGEQPAVYWTDEIDQSYASSVLQDDPGWYYRLNDGGNAVAVNYGHLGSSYNASYVDGTVTIVSGVEGNEANSALLNSATGDGDPDAAAQFTADGGYFLIPDGAALGQTFSLEFWVNFDSLEAGQILMQKQQLATDETPNPVPDWTLTTGEGGTIIFDPGFSGGTIETAALKKDAWYYVVATLDTSFDGTQDAPVATLYLGDDEGTLQVVGQQQGSEAPVATNSTIVAGQNFNGKLDELALYPSLLTLATEAETDEDGNVTNYNPGPNSSGGITSHYAARFNLPENVVGSGTFYAVLEEEGWGDLARFQPENKAIPTEILLQRNPVFDIASVTELAPDGETDLRLNFTPVGGTSPVVPNDTIISLKVVNSDQSKTWSTDWANDGHLPLAVVQGGKLLNDNDGISKTLLGAADNFDLYFQGTDDGTGNYSVEVTLEKPLSGGQETFSATFSNLPLLPNPAANGAIGDIISANGDILEDEVSKLAQIDSGLSLETSEDHVGQALLAGNFLTGGAAAIAVGAPFADSNGDGHRGDGVVLVLTAGDKETLVGNNVGVTVDPGTIPGNGTGIRIMASGTDSLGENLGSALAVGDIDGGGTDDLVIGAPLADGGKGKVYILFGENLTPGQTVDLSTSSDVAVISGFSSAAEAGYSLAVGKINDDEYADIVIGAPYAQEAAGEVYVVYGGEGFNGTTSPELLFTGEALSFAGFSLEVSESRSDGNGGTMNSFSGDAYADVIIGAPQYSQEVSFSEDFINVNGSIPQSAIDALRDVSAVQVDNNNFSGNSFTLTTGRTYVLSGNGQNLATGLTEETFGGTVLDGTPIFNTDVEAGYSVSAAGDIDGDGTEDLAIGAPGESKGAGQVYVVAGGRDLSGNGVNNPFNLAWESNLVIAGPEPHARTGSQVTDAGDFNGDLVDDLVVASPQAGYSAGQAHVIFGNGSTNSALWKVGEYSTAIALSPGGSSFLETFNEADNLATAPTPVVSTFVLNGSNPQDGLVIGKSNVDLDGEVDGDVTTDDLLAADLYGNQLGILFGHPWLNDEGSLKVNQLKSDQGLIVQQEASEAIRQEVELLGDLNGDGFDEFLVSGKANESLIVFGGGTKELLDLSLATRELSLKHQGVTEFASLGDTNGDGLEDVGATTNISSNVLTLNEQGRAVVPTNQAINFANDEEYTVEFLVKVDPVSGTDAPFFLAKGNPFESSEIGVPFAFRLFESGTNAGKIRAFINDKNKLPSVGSNVRIDDGLYHHVALVKEDNQLRLYIDGVFQNGANTEPGRPPNSTQNDLPLTIGKVTDGSPGFEGSIDELRIWKGARTVEQIQKNRVALQDASGALHLDGKTAFAKVDANEALNSFDENTNFTIEAFIQVEPNGQQDTSFVTNNIIEKWTGNSSDGYPFSIRYYNNTESDPDLRGRIVGIRSDGTNGFSVATTTDFSDGVGRHVAFVKEGQTYRIYVNGVLENQVILEAEETPVNVANDQPLILGTRPVENDSGEITSGTNFFTGKIDEVRVWDTVRTQTQIQENLAYSIANPINEPNLVTYLTMEGRVLKDESIQASNANLEGGAVLGVDELSSVGTELVAYYSMEDNTLTDLSTTQNDGSIENGISFEEQGQFTIASLLTGNNSLGTSGTINLNDLSNLVLPPGFSLNSAKDINGDGLNDWLVQTSTRSAYLFWGNTDNDLSDSSEISLGNYDSLTSILDNNGDGFDDLVATNSTGNSMGKVVFGGDQFNEGTLNISELQGQTFYYQEGFSNNVVAIDIGDINGDGLGDLASLTNGDLAVLLVTTGNGFNQLTGIQVSDNVGDLKLKIGAAGDVNGDGIDDVHIAVPSLGTNYIIYGNKYLQDSSGDEIGPGIILPSNLNVRALTPAASTTTSIPGKHGRIKILGQVIEGLANSQSGITISGGSDINGDGFNDMAIGTDFDDNLSYILFGGDFTGDLTQGGSIANDVFEGTATGDVIIGNVGNDYMIGNGGQDVMYGGAGDDIFTINDNNFQRIDGGSGLDVIDLEGEKDQTWSLQELVLGGRLRNIEAINIQGHGNNLLVIDPLSLVNLSSTSNMLIVDADAGNNGVVDGILDTEGAFTFIDTYAQNGFTYDVYQAANATLFVTPGVEVSSMPNGKSLGLLLDGETEALEAPGVSDLNFNRDSELTVEAWIQIEPEQLGSQTNKVILRKWNGESNSGFPFQLIYDSNTGKFVAERRQWNSALGPSTVSVQSQTLFNDGQPHHVAFVKSGTSPSTAKIHLYVDGVLEATADDVPYGFTNNNDPLQVGAITSGTGSNFLNGYVDEIRVWKMARTQEQIEENFQQKITNPSEETALVAYYNFDDGTPSDFSLTENDASFIGSPIIDSVELFSSDAVVVTPSVENSSIAGISATEEEETSSPEDPLVVDLGEFSNNSTLIHVSSPEIQAEAGGVAKFNVVRTGNPDTWLTLNVQTIDGSANDGVHFEGINNRLVFEPGEMSKTVAIPIVNDGILRQNLRSFKLQVTENVEVGGTFGDDNLKGRDGDDLLRGDGNSSEPGGNIGGDDTLNGGAGNDRLEGNGGNDMLLGGSGDDQLLGNFGRDDLQGGFGNDLLLGGESRDTLTGGMGNDIFVYHSIVDAGDIITDFEVGSDKIDLSFVLDSFEFAGSDPITDGYLGFHSRGTDTILTLDPDGGAGSARSRSFLYAQGVTDIQLNHLDNFII